MRPTLLMALSCAVAVGTSACSNGEVRTDTATSIVGEGQTGLTYSEVPGALATRREPQEYLERARSGILGGDREVAATSLTMAATMLREHAAISVSAARSEFDALTVSLDSLVRALNVGTVPGAKSFDVLVIRVNVAEADHHRSLAEFAWSKLDHKTAGEELIMSADHLDRALRDAEHRSRSANAAVQKALDVGGRMATAKSFKYWEVTTSLTALDRTIRDLRRP